MFLVADWHFVLRVFLCTSVTIPTALVTLAMEAVLREGRWQPVLDFP